MHNALHVNGSNFQKSNQSKLSACIFARRNKCYPNLSLQTPIKLRLTTTIDPHGPNQHTYTYVQRKIDMTMYFNTNIFL